MKIRCCGIRAVSLSPTFRFRYVLRTLRAFWRLVPKICIIFAGKFRHPLDIRVRSRRGIQYALRMRRSASTTERATRCWWRLVHLFAKTRNIEGPSRLSRINTQRPRHSETLLNLHHRFLLHLFLLLFLPPYPLVGSFILPAAPPPPPPSSTVLTLARLSQGFFRTFLHTFSFIFPPAKVCISNKKCK